MMYYLFQAYKVFMILFYIFCSLTLFYKRLIKRWFHFTLFYIPLYFISVYFLFGFLPFQPATTRSVEQVILALPYILFFIGSPILVGYWVYKDLGMKGIVGRYLVYCGGLVVMIILTTNALNASFGFWYPLNPYTQAYIELIFFYGTLLAFPAVIGYCLAGDYSLRQSFGILILFFVVAGVLAVTIHLTMGFEYLPQALRM